MKGRDRIAEYQLAIVLAELEQTRSQSLPATMPDIDRLLSKPAIHCAALRLQELIWTLRRLTTRNESGSLSLPRSPGGAQTRTGLFFDVTALHRGSTRGGIRRLSQQIVQHAMTTGLATPTYVKDGRVWPLVSGTVEPVELAAGDVFVIVPFFWEPFEEYEQIIVHARAAGTRVAVFVHDVIPGLYPGLMFSRFHERFRSVLPRMAEQVDMIVTLSRSSSEAVRAFLAADGKPDCSPPIRWFHMGSNATRQTGMPACGGPIRGLDIFARKTFLTVGTLTPHKGVPVALSAFERAWAEGLDANYLVVGQADGDWKSIPARIKSHPQYGKRLFWFDDFDDAELADAYTRCHCYIQPSIDEGFGIPLAEAASYERPIIATDIPVFREIGSDDILYFARCDASDLADKIAHACTHPLPVARIALQDWRQSFLQLISLLRELQGGIDDAACSRSERSESAGPMTTHLPN